MLPNINSMGKWARILFNEIIYGIWDFTAGLKAAKIGIGQAPGTELLEIAKDTDVSVIAGRAKIGYDGTNADYAMFAHYDRAINPNWALMQSAGGNTILNGSAVSCRVYNNAIFGLSSTGMALSAGKILTTVYVSDADSDTDDVLSTGITAKFGLVLIKETTGNKFCLYRIKGDNSIPIIVDGDAEFAAVKDNPATYNFYYEANQFKLQNKVGDNKALYVGLYLV